MKFLSLSILILITKPALAQGTAPSFEGIIQKLTEAANQLSSSTLPAVASPDSYDFWNSISNAETERVKAFDAILIKHLNRATKKIIAIDKEYKSSAAVIQSVLQERSKYEASGALDIWEESTKERSQAIRDQTKSELVRTLKELGHVYNCLSWGYRCDFDENNPNNLVFSQSFYAPLNEPTNSDSGRMIAGKIYYDLIENHTLQIYSVMEELGNFINQFESSRRRNRRSRRAVKDTLGYMRMYINFKEERLAESHLLFLKRQVK